MCKLNRVIGSWIGGLLLFFAAFFNAAGQTAFAPDEIVVKLKRQQDLLLVAKKYGLHPKPIERFGRRPIYRMRILGGAAPEPLAERMLEDPQRRIVYAEPNFILGFPESNGNSWMIGGSSGGYVAQWFRDPLRLAAAHQVTQGANVKIAVLDTGVAFGHPQLAGRLVPGYDFVDDDADPSEVGAQPQNPGYGHGTHVAGLVALVAPQAQLMPVRVLDENGVGNIWVLAEAIAYAADPDGNPNTPDGADVINLSLATQRETDLLEEIIDEVTCDDDDDLAPRAPQDGTAAALFGEGLDELGEEAPCPLVKDTIVVAGAGNRASDLPEYPAGEALEGLISVAATTPADTLAAFSNYGSWVRVGAPGQNILSTVPPNLFAVWSGTSMATPLVAGQAALVRAQNPQMTAGEIVNRIVSTADPISAPVPLRVDVASSLLVPQDAPQ